MITVAMRSGSTQRISKSYLQVGQLRGEPSRDMGLNPTAHELKI